MHFTFKKSSLLTDLPGMQYIPVTAIGNWPQLHSRRLSVTIISTLSCSFVP